MKIDVRKPLLDYRGKPIIEGENHTIRDYVAIAMNGALNTEVLTGEQKATSYRISTKLYSSNEPDLTLAELAYIKERAEKLLPALHAGRIIDIVEEREALPILPDAEFEDPKPKKDEAKPSSPQAEPMARSEKVLARR